LPDIKPDKRAVASEQTVDGLLRLMVQDIYATLTTRKED
jgi:hypothetical protein